MTSMFFTFGFLCLFLLMVVGVLCSWGHWKYKSYRYMKKSSDASTIRGEVNAVDKELLILRRHMQVISQDAIEMQVDFVLLLTTYIDLINAMGCHEKNLSEEDLANIERWMHKASNFKDYNFDRQELKK